MSRSRRLPIQFAAVNCIATQAAKRIVSRRIRRAAKWLLAEGVEDLQLGPQDRVRGRKGSRDPDWGWRYWGDGIMRLPWDWRGREAEAERAGRK